MYRQTHYRLIQKKFIRLLSSKNFALKILYLYYIIFIHTQAARWVQKNSFANRSSRQSCATDILCIRPLSQNRKVPKLSIPREFIKCFFWLEAYCEIHIVNEILLAVEAVKGLSAYYSDSVLDIAWLTTEVNTWPPANY